MQARTHTPDEGFPAEGPLPGEPHAGGSHVGGPGEPAGHGAALTRRTVVTGTGMLAAVAALAACSSYGDQGSAPTGTGGYPSEPAPGASPESPPSAGATALAGTADIPVGGGAIFTDEKVVVTQPVAGEFRAFSAVCTHQGCTVNEVVDGTIDCPCHGSKFSITDGSPVAGPAKKPLPPRTVAVEGDSIQLT